MTPRNAFPAGWTHDPRWAGIRRPYRAADVLRLRGSIEIEHTLARLGAERLWTLLDREPYVAAMGAMTGNQAVEQVRAGLEAVYASGWQVAADANTAGEMYPDQSLYPADGMPSLVRRINRALARADQIHHAEGKNSTCWFAPIVADGEAGFGGNLNTFELTKATIEAGAAAIHFEDQIASAKKCGHLGGKVVVPTREFIQKLVAARLAADVSGVPTILIARTDANSARLIASDVDPYDHRFLGEGRTKEGFLTFRGGLDAAIARGLAYAPYADLLWCETSGPNLDEAREFARKIHAHFPGKWLAYNCSSSFNWVKALDTATLRRFQTELARMGYKFQFITLAGFHSLNLGMFELARAYRETGMLAYANLQQQELRLAEECGYEAVTHQRFVGTGYFDDVAQTIAGGTASTAALAGSTEVEQFTKRDAAKEIEKAAPKPSRPDGRSQPEATSLL